MLATVANYLRFNSLSLQFLSCLDQVSLSFQYIFAQGLVGENQIYSNVQKVSFHTNIAFEKVRLSNIIMGLFDRSSLQWWQILQLLRT